MFDALEKRFKKDQKDSRTQEKSTDKPETEEGGGGEGGEGGRKGEEEGGGGEVEGGGDGKEKKSDGASSSQTVDDSSKEQIAKPRVSISVPLRLYFPTLLELGMIACTCFLIIIFPHQQSVLLEERIDIHVHVSVYFQFCVLLIFNLFSCNSECILSKCELINKSYIPPYLSPSLPLSLPTSPSLPLPPYLSLPTSPSLPLPPSLSLPPSPSLSDTLIQCTVG